MDYIPNINIQIKKVHKMKILDPMIKMMWIMNNHCQNCQIHLIQALVMSKINKIQIYLNHIKLPKVKTIAIIL